MTLETFHAVLSRDGKTLLMRRGDWSLRCPATDLVKWLTMYERLWSRGAKPGEPGPWAKFYAQPVEALRKLAGRAT